MCLTVLAFFCSTQIHKKAIEAFEEALKLDPTNEEIKKELR
jgi:cytochrome c-type biogenesis protein CcmH/NrfG